VAGSAAKRAPAAKRATPKRPARRAPRERRAGRRRPPSDSPAAPHVEIANAYARRVVAGEETAGKYEILAARRHLAELERPPDADFPYQFNADAAERICRFAELLRHVKGPKAGQRFQLEPWQCFVLCSIFGWLHWKSMLRRFRRFYLEIARGNGKSFLLAVIALFMLVADGEAGAEVYSAAKTRDQAKAVFEAARMIAKANTAADFRAYYGLDVREHSILQPSSGSAFRALANDADSLDGLNVHFAAVDELHAHPTRKVYDVLETAISKRDQPLLGVITTAGSDRTGICYELRTDLVNVLQGTATDHTLFGIVFTIDDTDDWRDERIWRKANPNLGVSVNLDTLRSLAKKAERTPAAQAAFKTKHLDIWVGANAALHNIEDWNACADTTLAPEQFEGETALAGIDLATDDDLAPRVDVFRREIDGEFHYYTFAKTYISQGAVDDGRNASYSGWVIEGWLLTNDGDTTDLQRLEDEVVEDSDRFQFEEIAYDGWQAAGLAQRLQARGATMVKIAMNAANLSEPVKLVNRLIKERRIHHNGDPVFAWCIGNVVGHFDKKENVYPQKERPENKIDLAVALYMAMNRWIVRGDEPPPANESPVEVLD
jgi:phage terminase large subunit-like protein